MPASAPVLSICIPTYNRADLLDLCLATVLPQVAEHAGRVECVIRDNASPDHTAAVIGRYEKDYPLRRHRNDENLGGLVNVLDIALRQARGEYIWLIGDDDTLNRGAVAHLLTFLDRQESAHPDVIGVNVAYLPEAERPGPETGLGGITASSQHLMRQSGDDGPVPFDALFEAPSADFTAMYGFLLRRRVWIDSLGDWDPPRGNPFVCVEGTYPHACAVARALPNVTASVIRQPLVTIYELDPADFLWARFHPLNTLLWASALHRLFEQRGVSRETLQPFRQLQWKRAQERLPRMIREPEFAGGWPEAIRFVACTPGIRIPLVLLVLQIAIFQDPTNNWLLRTLTTLRTNFTRVIRYLSRDSRPARWWRAKSRNL